MLCFTKMHGTGNDYIYVNCLEHPPPNNLPVVAQEISHRRFGVGGDGLILIEPSPHAAAGMRISTLTEVKRKCVEMAFAALGNTCTIMDTVGDKR